MTPLATSNTLTPTPRFKEFAASAPQIRDEARATTAPWLFSAVAQLREVENTGENVAGLGDLRISLETAKRARQLLSSIETTFLPSPLVAPVSGGGVSVTWAIGPREVKLAFEPDGSTYFFKFEDDEMLNDPDEIAPSSTSVADGLRWMIRRKS